MAELATALAQIQARELDANEQAIANCFPEPPGLPTEAQLHLVPFLQWCRDQRVRSLPARPTSVAAFVQRQRDQNVPKDQIAGTLSAVEQLHNAAGLANPIATPPVRRVSAASTIERPSGTADRREFR